MIDILLCFSISFRASSFHSMFFSLSQFCTLPSSNTFLYVLCVSPVKITSFFPIRVREISCPSRYFCAAQPPSLILSWAFSWLRVLHLQGLAGVATWMLCHLIKSIVCLSQIEFTTSSPELTFCSSFCVISIILLAILKGTKKDL